MCVSRFCHPCPAPPPDPWKRCCIQIPIRSASPQHPLQHRCMRYPQTNPMVIFVYVKPLLEETLSVLCTFTRTRNNPTGFHVSGAKCVFFCGKLWDGFAQRSKRRQRSGGNQNGPQRWWIGAKQQTHIGWLFTKTHWVEQLHFMVNTVTKRSKHSNTMNIIILQKQSSYSDLGDTVIISHCHNFSSLCFDWCFSAFLWRAHVSSGVALVSGSIVQREQSVWVYVYRFSVSFKEHHRVLWKIWGGGKWRWEQFCLVKGKRSQ